MNEISVKDAFRHIVSLGIKELYGFLRDPVLMILIVYSFTLTVYSGAATQPDAIDHSSIAIVDEDGSALTKRLNDAFFPPLFQRPKHITRGEIDTAMDSGLFTFIVVFPPKFQENVLAGHNAEIQVNIDATMMTEAFTGNGYIQDILTREVNQFVQEQQNSGEICSADYILRHRFNVNVTCPWTGSLNMLISNIAMIAMILTGSALIRERERGTLEHLMVTPITPFQIMVSKVWSMSLIVFIAAGFSLYFVVHLMVGSPIVGSFWLYMATVIISLFSLTSLGIFLACFSKDMPQLGLMMILVLMPMNILSGGASPLCAMPKFIQYVMRLAPNTYMVELGRMIIFRGAGFELVWGTMFALFLVGCAYFTIALKRFRKSVAS